MKDEEVNKEMSQLNSIEVIEFTEAEEFIDYLRPSKNHWGDVGLDWYFRGHGDAEWVLKPRAWRNEGQNILRPISKAMKPGLKYLWSDIKGRLDHGLNKNESFSIENILHNASELEVVHQFADLADELGYPISPDN